MKTSKNKKSIILKRIISNNYDCKELNCRHCPFFFLCPYDRECGITFKKRVQELYLELYGEEDLMEALL